MHASRFSTLGPTVALALCSVACDSGGGGETAAGFDDQAVVVDYVDHVIIPTYTQLATRAEALSAAVDALAAGPDPATVAAAREAWLATREPWEQSEAFLFGPVDSNGYDPALDTWPLNEADLNAVLEGTDTLTVAFVESLPESQKGFHTVEYLIFGVDNRKTADAFTERELQYLTAATGEMARIAGLLAKSWTTSVDGRPPYAEVFRTAGEPGNTAYPSLGAAGQEIVQGMIGILDEVANGKIAEPYDNHDPRLVESQFSFNSQVDFQDNIRGVRRAWLGLGPEDSSPAGASLSAFVARRDSTLSARVLAELDAGIAAIAAIPAPFRDAITDDAASGRIEAAQAALRKAQTTIESAVVPLILE
jgi:uncharacterized iron-regulated protein